MDMGIDSQRPRCPRLGPAAAPRPLIRRRRRERPPSRPDWAPGRLQLRYGRMSSPVSTVLCRAANQQKVRARESGVGPRQPSRAGSSTRPTRGIDVGTKGPEGASPASNQLVADGWAVLMISSRAARRVARHGRPGAGCCGRGKLVDELPRGQRRPEGTRSCAAGPRASWCVAVTTRSPAPFAPPRPGAQRGCWRRPRELRHRAGPFAVVFGAEPRINKPCLRRGRASVQQLLDRCVADSPLLARGRDAGDRHAQRRPCPGGPSVVGLSA